MGKYEVIKSKCAECGACILACLCKAIKIDIDGKANIDPEKCNGCDQCKKVCSFEDVIISCN